MLPKGGIFIKKILWIFLLPLIVVGACNYFSGYNLTIDNITLDATRCNYSVTVTGQKQKKPDILITIGKVPEVTNPFAIIEAFGYIQQLQENISSYQETNEELTEVLEKIHRKISITKKLYETTKDKEILKSIEKLE